MSPEPTEPTEPGEATTPEAEEKGERAARRRRQFAWAAKVSRPMVGWGLLAIGAIALLAGYWGVANEALVAKQLPYLISGGIGGMVLVAVGAFLLGTHDVRQQLGRVEELEHLVRELHWVLLVGGTTTAPDRPEVASAGSASPNGAATAVVALDRGRSYHRPSCGMVDGKDVKPVDAATIARRDLSPCSVCEPEAVTAERPRR